MSALWPIAVGALPTVIDLYHDNAGFNKASDFVALRAAGVRQVIHKITQGVDFVDEMYAARKPLALTAGLAWSAYHFCTADPVDVQLSHLMSVAGDDAGLGLCLDAEDNGNDTITPENAGTFAQTLDAHVGYQVLRYGGLGHDAFRVDAWRSGPMWWAKYGSEPTVELMTSLGVDPTNVVLWQETESGRVAGDSPVDLSYARDGVGWSPDGSHLASVPPANASDPLASLPRNPRDLQRWLAVNAGYRGVIDGLIGEGSQASVGRAVAARYP